EDDDAEIIFPYEVQGDQTPPPRDESSDYEFEAEEADDELEIKEAGIKPEALMRDLEALRRHERIREAESETSRTEIALLGSEAKIGKKWREKYFIMILVNERFYLEMVRKGAVPKPPSDDEGSECSRKTSKKSDGDEGPYDPHGPLMIMPPKPIAGGSGGTGGNAGGTGVRDAGPTVPKLTGCTYVTFTKCDLLPFNGTEGAWNERTNAMGIEAANNTPWSEVKKWMT
nr:hypothetical protein [Tanacetum cinerariifolium]